MKGSLFQTNEQRSRKIFFPDFGARGLMSKAGNSLVSLTQVATVAKPVENKATIKAKRPSVRSDVNSSLSAKR